MTEKTKGRLLKIRSSVEHKRRRLEKYLMSAMLTLSLFLFSGLGATIREMQTPEAVNITDGYGAVLLGRASPPCALVGLIAFALGALLAYLKTQPNSLIRAERMLSKTGSKDQNL